MPSIGVDDSGESAGVCMKCCNTNVDHLPVLPLNERDVFVRDELQRWKTGSTASGGHRVSASVSAHVCRERAVVLIVQFSGNCSPQAAAIWRLDANECEKVAGGGCLDQIQKNHTAHCVDAQANNLAALDGTDHSMFQSDCMLACRSKACTQYPDLRNVREVKP